MTRKRAARTGAQANQTDVMVSAMLDQTVLQVFHLRHDTPGRPRPLTRVLQVSGLLLCVGGAAGALAGQVGVGAALMLLGVAQSVLAQGKAKEERRSPHFTVGPHREASFPAPAEAVPEARFPLVRRGADGEAELIFSPSMKGELQLGGKVHSFHELAAAGLDRAVAPGSAVRAVALPSGSRARVTLGEMAFFVEAGPPERGVGVGLLRGVDWNAQVFTGLSFAAHGLVLFMLLTVPPSGKVISLDTFNVDNAQVRYLITAKHLQREEVPAWLKRQVEPAKKSGDPGSAHKGKSGKMGKKESKKKKGRYALKGPGDNKKLTLAKHLAEQQVQHIGLLKVLGAPRGGAIASIFSQSESALGKDIETVMGGLLGDTTGEMYGVGGLGISGTGRGGDGVGEGIGYGGPLGTIGKGGQGGPGDDYGRSIKLPDRKHRTRVPPRAEAVVEKGSLSKSLIRRVVRQHINEVRYCYQRELQTQQDLFGRLVVRFTIAGNGRVVMSNLQRSSLGNTTVERCIVQAVRRWEFPRPQGGGIVVVSYPFVLRAAGAQ